MIIFAAISAVTKAMVNYITQGANFLTRIEFLLELHLQTNFLLRSLTNKLLSTHSLELKLNTKNVI